VFAGVQSRMEHWEGNAMASWGMKVTTRPGGGGPVKKGNSVELNGKAREAEARGL